MASLDTLDALKDDEDKEENADGINATSNITCLNHLESTASSAGQPLNIAAAKASTEAITPGTLANETSNGDEEKSDEEKSDESTSGSFPLRDKPILRHIRVVVANEEPFIFSSRYTFAQILVGTSASNTIWSIVRQRKYMITMALAYLFTTAATIYDLRHSTQYSIVGVMNIALQIFISLLINPKMLYHALAQIELQYAMFNVLGSIVTLLAMFNSYAIRLGLLSVSLFSLNLTIIDAWPTSLRRQAVRFFGLMLLVYSHVLWAVFALGYIKPDHNYFMVLGVRMSLLSRFLGFQSFCILMQWKNMLVFHMSHKDRLPMFWFNLYILNTTQEGLDNLVGIHSVLLSRDKLSQKYNESATRRFSRVAQVYAEGADPAKINSAHDLLVGRQVLEKIGGVSMNSVLRSESVATALDAGRTRIVFPMSPAYEIQDWIVIGYAIFGYKWTARCERFCRKRWALYLTLLLYIAGICCFVASCFEPYTKFGIFTPCFLMPILLVWVSLYSTTLFQQVSRTWSVIFYNISLWTGAICWAIMATNPYTMVSIFSFAIFQCFKSCIDAFPRRILSGRARALANVPSMLALVVILLNMFFMKLDTVNPIYVSVSIIHTVDYSLIDIVLTSFFGVAVYCLRNIRVSLARPDCFVNLVSHARALPTSEKVAEAVIKVHKDALDRRPPMRFQKSILPRLINRTESSATSYQHKQ